MNKHVILDFHFFLPCEEIRLVKILYACQSSFEVQMNITVFFLQNSNKYKFRKYRIGLILDFCMTFFLNLFTCCLWEYFSYF